MRVAILGVGRLGGSMARLLPKAGVDVVTWSRGAALPVGADVYWVTVADSAVAEVAARLPRDATVLHAAGAHGPELLGERRERGVLHPLMTFPGVEVGIPDLHGVGARVDGTPGALRAARALAERLGMRAFHLEGDPRLYHAAASIVSGHLSALFLDAAEILSRAGVPTAEARTLLLPLAMESLRRVSEAGGVALTGPAARGDTATERHHQLVLTPDEAVVYTTLSARVRLHR